MKKLIQGFLRRFGYEIKPIAALTDLGPEESRIINICRPYTMTSLERLTAAISATQYIVKNRIPGEIVECGVWAGGSMMAIAHTLIAAGDTSRKLYLYDTFEGMSAPTDHDRTYKGESAEKLLIKNVEEAGSWCRASLDDVKRNLISTGYPEANLIFVKGKVEDTIPATLPPALALLRLDTDWYESTKHELVHLYPLLQNKGVLIIDDYGYWQGARKAVDEYFNENSLAPYLHRIDLTGRITIKS